MNPRRPPSQRSRGYALFLMLVLVLLAAGALSAWMVVRHFERDLPSVATLRDIQLSVPLRVWTRDGKLMGEFGTERRALMKFSELPPRLVDAFLAAEDDRFFSHAGVDYAGLVRAALAVAASGGDKSQGGSTITMQLARNVFLTSEKTYTRKIREILLARRIEKELSKEEILEIYLNKIFLGERAYGVGAAALAYFGRPLAELGLEEFALIAALPKAPSRDNPIVAPERARERRDYVLRRMREVGSITAAEYEEAVERPVRVSPYRAKVDVDAHYVAEMVRAQLYEQYGEEAYTRGYNVTTTLDAARQSAAVRALREGLHDYDERHGWRKPEARIENPAALDANALRAALAAQPPIADLPAAVVISASAERLQLLSAEGELTLAAEDFKWANLGGKRALTAGDVVRVRRVGERWRLAQLPEAQAALVAVDPRDGAINALAGGYDFFIGKFNRVTQARRQAGSGFKPFLYAAGLSFGFTPASVILDAPVVFDDPNLESAWRPENYSGKFYGPTRLREALVDSRNLVSIRLLQAVGLDATRDYAARFGLDKERLQRDLTLALGSSSFTPLEIARAYAVLANGGFRVEPYFIAELRDASGQVVFRAQPPRACAECEVQRMAAAAGEPVTAESGAPRVIEPQVAWLINDMLREVTQRGTAAAVNQLGRSDLAGKTGTTNDETDAWFNGYHPTQVAVSWVGFDQPTPLGRGEVGGRAALPIWMDYMRVALKDVPAEFLPRPSGLVNVRINPANGRLAAAGAPDAVFETVQADRIPEPDNGGGASSEGANGVEDLF